MNTNGAQPEVLTLIEAARLLRVKKAVLLELADQGRVPARKVGDEWRFSRIGLDEWLRGKPDSRSIFLSQAGAFKDDPTLMPMLEKIYKARGRPIIGKQDEE